MCTRADDVDHGRQAGYPVAEYLGREILQRYHRNISTQQKLVVSRAACLFSPLTNHAVEVVLTLSLAAPPQEPLAIRSSG